MCVCVCFTVTVLHFSNVRRSSVGAGGVTSANEIRIARTNAEEFRPDGNDNAGPECTWTQTPNRMPFAIYKCNRSLRFAVIGHRQNRNRRARCRLKWQTLINFSFFLRQLPFLRCDLNGCGNVAVQLLPIADLRFRFRFNAHEEHN